MAIVRYLVTEIDASIDFYRLLNFELIDQWGKHFAVMQLSDLTLWLSGPDTSAQKQIENSQSPAPGGWNRIVIAVTSIDQNIRALSAKGIKFRSQLIKGPGGSHILCDDPSGNPIELFQT